MFGLCQIHAFIDYLRSKLSRAQFDTLFWSLSILVALAALIVGGTLTFLGSKGVDFFTCSSMISFIVQRFLHGLVGFTHCWTLPMLKTTFPSLPLSVSISLPLGPPSISTCNCWCSCFLVCVACKGGGEHCLDIQVNAVGLFFCFSKLTDQNIFIILYGLTSVYFAVSLPLVL